MNPLTLDEHRALSQEMRQMTRRMRAFCEMVVGAYGPHSNAAHSFQRAIEDVEHLNQDLNAQAADDGFPGNDLYT